MTYLPDSIVDAHHHLWNPISNSPDIGYRWLKAIGAAKPFGDPTGIQRDYLLKEFLGEPGSAKLAASAHLQADGAIEDPVAETRFIQDISTRSSFPIAIVGFVDLTRDDAGDTIQRHKQSPNFRGVRQIISRLDDRPDLSFAPEHYLRNIRWQQNFSLLRDEGLSFDLQLYPEQMQEAAEFLSDHADTPVIIDHAGSPYDQGSDGISRWRDGMARLADLPNTSVKLCGFGMFDRNWNGDSIRPIIATIAELFGPQRTLFASNFPVDKLMRPYRSSLGDIAGLYADYSSQERAAIFHDNARRIYRI